MPNFDTLNSSGAAEKLLTDATPPNAAACLAFLRGDHFQNGTQWIGPPPPPEEYSAAIASLRKVFVPVPVCEEMVEGHVTGAIGHEPAFEYRLRRPLGDDEEYTPDELAAKAEADSEFGDWFDRRGGLTILHDWAQKLKSAGETQGRATLRLMIPPGLLQDIEGESRIEAETPAEAMNAIYLKSPEVEAATVYTDPETERECGIFRYDARVKSEGSNRISSKRRVELCFVADADDDSLTKGQTVLRVLEGKTLVSEIVMDMGGFPLMFEGRLPSLLTPPVLSNQRAMDMINTMLPLNAAYAGFRKTDMINVGSSPTDGNGNPTETTTGPSQIGFWYSQPYKDTEGKVHHFPPQLIVTEPVDSGALRADISALDTIIRRACKQAHTAMSADNTASAVARIQARAVFLNDLLRTTPVVEAALRWLQMAVRCFALWLCNRESEIPAFVEQFAPFAQCKPSTGPLTPEEVRVLIEMYKAGLMSREDAALLFGVEDVTAFLERIESEEGSNMTYQKDVAELYNIWVQSLSSLDAAEMAGIDDERMLAILRRSEQSTLGVNDGG